MEILEVCEGKIYTGANPVRKNRLFAIMDKYHSSDGVPDRFCKTPPRPVPLSQKKCSDPQKNKKKEDENGSAVRHKKVSFREEKQKLDLNKNGGANQNSSNDEKIVVRPARAVQSPVLEVNLAAVAIEMRVKVRAADMPAVQQERAFRCGRQCFDALHKIGFRQVAFTLKKEFDKCYGPAWHCIVGRSFGSFVTHSSGGFLYFSMDKLYILLFKTPVQPIDQNSLRE